MNEPIISPWLIYWVTRIEHLHDLLSNLSLVAVLSIIPLFIFFAGVEASNEMIKKYCKRWAIATLTLVVLLNIFNTFVPKKEVIIAMYAAKQVTPANIQTAGELADKGIDYIGGKAGKGIDYLGDKADKAGDAAVEKIIRIIDAIKKEEKKND